VITNPSQLPQPPSHPGRTTKFGCLLFIAVATGFAIFYFFIFPDRGVEGTVTLLVPPGSKVRANDRAVELNPLLTKIRKKPSEMFLLRLPAGPNTISITEPSGGQHRFEIQVKRDALTPVYRLVDGKLVDSR